MNMENVMKELRKLFIEFNIKYFDGQLEEPVITVQTNGRSKSTMGWSTEYQVWQRENEEVKKYEINICPEFLDSSFYVTCDTVLHEMVHLYNTCNGIADINSNGKTHNKRFKEEAERRGLCVEKGDKVGWAVTSLSPQTEMFVDQLDIDRSVFEWKRVEFVKPKKTRTPAIKHKYVCPECKAKFESKKKINAMCEDCNVVFKEEGQV